MRFRLPRLRRAVLYGLGAVALVLLCGFVWIDRSIVRRFEARSASVPSRVYAIPFTASRGGRLDVAGLLDRLRRLDYEEVRGEPTRPGTFARDGKDWTIYLRSAVTPDGEHEALAVRLDVSFRRLREITDLRTGEQMERFSLEPESLMTFYADVMEERRLTPLAEVPLELRQAVEV